jgi:transposase
MPARRRKDVSDDLKQVVVANSNTGMSYRAIASITGLSLGAIAGILKVRTLLILGGGRG